MRIGLPKSCLYCFPLKQGTILIAIAQLLMCGIGITLCLLGLTHAMDIEEMVVRDSEDALEREAFEDDNSMHLNTKRMKIAHHNATDKIYTLYLGLILVVFHFASVILLLYGILVDRRNLMTPWLFLSTIEFGSMMVAAVYRHYEMKDATAIRIFALLMALIMFYGCLIVYSTYRSLDNKKGLTHEIHGVKKKYANPQTQCSKSRSRPATEPHEV